MATLSLLKKLGVKINSRQRESSKKSGHVQEGVGKSVAVVAKQQGYFVKKKSYLRAGKTINVNVQITHEIMDVVCANSF